MNTEIMFAVAKSKPKGSFADFSGSKLETIAFLQGKKIKFLVVEDADRGRHNISLEELSDLQDRFPNKDILMKADGTRAVLGEQAYLSPDVVIAREDGLLICL